MLLWHAKEGNRGFGYIKYKSVPKMEIGDSIVKLNHEKKIRKIPGHEVLGEWE
jgi:hypothetical protein